MTDTAIIPKFFPAVKLTNRKKCLANQLERQREITPSFVSELPKRPYCTNNLKHGLVIRPRESAILKPYIEINPPKMVHWLIFDIDRDNGSFAWEDFPGLKAPNFAVVNPKNGHAHLYYKLSIPVCRSEMAHVKPLKYLSSMEYTYSNCLGADKAYTGLIAKNPLHPAHSLILFRPLSKPYTMRELALNVDLETRPKKVSTGIGRNVDLFESARIFAYKAIRTFWKPGGYSAWEKAVKTHCNAINTFSSPLPESEVRAISKSIASWTWKRITPGGFHSEQAERGRRSGQKRREATEDKRASARLLKANGKTVREIAETLGVSVRTVQYWTN